jgi:NitT/TauT family transport system permease protein
LVRILHRATKFPEGKATSTSKLARAESLETVIEKSVSQETTSAKPLKVSTPLKSQDVSLPIKVALFLVSFALFLGLWEVGALALGNPVILSEPIPVLAALAGLLQNQIPYGAQGLESAYSAIAETLEIIVAGFGLSLIGIPIGIVMGRWKAAESIIDPWVNAIYAIPTVALIPVLYFAIGGSFAADVFVAFLLSVFTLIVNTYSGVKYVSSSLAEVGKTYGASELQFLTKIIFPASLPDIVAGMRLGMGRAVLGAVVAETLLSINSLGEMMMTFQMLLNTPYLMAVVFIIALMGIFVLQTPKLLERRLFKWKEGERLSRGLRG